jgi:hypothetical protein
VTVVFLGNETAPQPKTPPGFPDKIQKVVDDHTADDENDKQNVPGGNPIEERFLDCCHREVDFAFREPFIGTCMTLAARLGEVCFVY